MAMTEEQLKNLIEQLKDPDIHFPGNFDTVKRANAMLMCLCQEAADALSEKSQPASAPSEQKPRFECWSTNEGDSWYESPDDAELLYDVLGDSPKVGDEFEVMAGWRSVPARYRIVSQKDDDFEVECISHPEDNAAPQPDHKAQQDAERYRWLREQHWNESNMCVVMHPKNAVRLGHECPSDDRLDAYIDAAIASVKGGE